MSSTNTYKPYCVYITHYSGDLLPQNYIGSTSILKIENGYRGSVTSKKYKSIWVQELKGHPELFSVDIISTHDTRREATYKELQLQKMFNVVKSDLFVNMTYATVNGYCGRDVSGENNGNFGNKNKGTSGLMLINNGKITKYILKFNLIPEGWSLGNIKGKQGKYKRYEYKITSPEGMNYVSTNLRKFCREHNLSRSSMCSVSNGARSTYKGWLCTRTEV